jgi:hypothetical protein
VTLQARGLLIAEIKDLLQGIYGLDGNGRYEDVKRLPAVQSLPAVKETRRQLEKFLKDEEMAGLKGRAAVDKLVKETAFTHLNRLVAFKMMESRKLIRGTLDRYQDSNAFKFYLADHEDDYRLYEQGSLPQNDGPEGCCIPAFPATAVRRAFKGDQGALRCREPCKPALPQTQSPEVASRDAQRSSA